MKIPGADTSVDTNRDAPAHALALRAHYESGKYRPLKESPTGTSLADILKRKVRPLFRSMAAPALSGITAPTYLTFLICSISSVAVN